MSCCCSPCPQALLLPPDIAPWPPKPAATLNMSAQCVCNCCHNLNQRCYCRCHDLQQDQLCCCRLLVLLVPLLRLEGSSTEVHTHLRMILTVSVKPS
jgi:hypothetical protein